jgi:2-polyprenyl-6-methoxyphenol hydroxylase-like FAD-dependent oxidoreductase
MLIIGTGIAGLSSALKLAEQGFQVGLVTRKIQILPIPVMLRGIIYSTESDDLLKEDIEVPA